MNENKFNGFADLDIAAIKEGLDRPLTVWYVARLCDAEGRGVVLIDSATKNFPPATKSRTLRAGQEIFWTRGDNDLYLRSPGAVAQRLGVQRLESAYLGATYWLDERSPALRRGRLALNGFAVKRAGRPIAVKTVADACGVTRRTVFRWQRATGWGKILNLSLLQRLKDPDTLKFSRKYADRPERLRMVRLGSDELWLAERLPNSLGDYRPVRRRAALRRANKKLLPCDLRGRGQQRIYVLPNERRRRPRTTSYHTLLHQLPALQVWVPSISPIKGDIFGMGMGLRRSVQ